MNLTEEQLNKVITINHFRSAGLCAKGTKNFSKEESSISHLSLKDVSAGKVRVKDLCHIKHALVEKLIKEVIKK